jgi:ketosteroid isomerase-like protein
MVDPAERELREVSEQWDRAMVESDAGAIGRFMADDWVVVGSDGNLIGKDRFLGLVASGTLSHNVMETHEMDVRVYGDTAVTIAAGVSGGHYQGHPFLLRDPVHLGDKVNSPDTDFCPFVTPDGKYFFFSRRVRDAAGAAAAGDVYWMDARFLDGLRK